MNNLKCVFSILALTVHSCVSAQLADPNADVLGKWKIVKHVSPTGATSSLSERDVQGLIGKPVLVAAGLFEFNGRRCTQPAYKRSVDDTADYFYREWRVNSDEMPIGKRVTIVVNRCGDNVLYPTSKNHLIIAEDGFFFEAVRAGSNAKATPEPVGPDNAQSRVNADIFGTWSIDGVTWAQGEAIPQERAKMLIGMPVYINANRFFYLNKTCKQPVYKRSKQEKTAYFHADWRADSNNLPLPDKLTVIETACGTIYPISKARIIIEDKNGLFYSVAPLLEQSSG